MKKNLGRSREISGSPSSLPPTPLRESSGNHPAAAHNSSAGMSSRSVVATVVVVTTIGIVMLLQINANGTAAAAVSSLGVAVNTAVGGSDDSSAHHRVVVGDPPHDIHRHADHNDKKVGQTSASSSSHQSGRPDPAGALAAAVVAAHHTDGAPVAAPTVGALSYERAPGCSSPPLQPWEKGKLGPASNCPDDGLIVHQWARRKQKHNWTIVEVGCNKGYVMQETLEALGLIPYQNLYWKIQNEKLGRRYANAKEKSIFCGACDDCYRSRLYDFNVANSAPAKHARAFAFDINTENVKWNSQIFSVYENVTFTGKAAAISDPERAGDFTKDVSVVDKGFGGEITRIASPGDPGNSLVPVTTVDHEIHDVAGFDHIDILLTDAEGFDYFVADGAQYFLDGGNAGFYLFETHGHDRKLGDHIARLHRAGWKCYFPQDAHAHLYRVLVPISGPCWLDRYDVGGFWGNVYCAHTVKAPELVEIMDALAWMRV